MNVFSYSNVENNSVCNLPGFIERKAFDFGQETEILMLEWAAFNLYDDRTRLLSTEYKASNERSGYTLSGNTVFNRGMFLPGRKLKRFESFCHIHVI